MKTTCRHEYTVSVEVKGPDPEENKAILVSYGADPLKITLHRDKVFGGKAVCQFAVQADRMPDLFASLLGFVEENYAPEKESSVVTTGIHTHFTIGAALHVSINVSHHVIKVLE